MFDTFMHHMESSIASRTYVEYVHIRQAIPDHVHLCNLSQVENRGL